MFRKLKKALNRNLRMLKKQKRRYTRLPAGKKIPLGENKGLVSQDQMYILRLL